VYVVSGYGRGHFGTQAGHVTQLVDCRPGDHAGRLIDCRTGDQVDLVASDQSIKGYEGSI
jgi:hypothetical protein